MRTLYNSGVRHDTSETFYDFINGMGVQGLPPHSTGYLNGYQWAILAGVSIPWVVVGANTAHSLPA